MCAAPSKNRNTQAHANFFPQINTPFILAPPLAAKAFYASISGAHRLPAPHSNFWAYPCNNPPFLHFEFGGWRFPVMRGTKSPYEHRGANGKFSLGKVTEDSGYCVGAVVESRMGVGDVSSVRKARTGRDTTTGESGIVAGNGLRDVWILGEPVFRGMGLVFDVSVFARADVRSRTNVAIDGGEGSRLSVILDGIRIGYSEAFRVCLLCEDVLRHMRHAATLNVQK